MPSNKLLYISQCIQYDNQIQIQYTIVHYVNTLIQISFFHLANYPSPVDLLPKIIYLVPKVLCQAKVQIVLFHNLVTVIFIFLVLKRVVQNKNLKTSRKQVLFKIFLHSYDVVCQENKNRLTKN